MNSFNNVTNRLSKAFTVSQSEHPNFVAWKEKTCVEHEAARVEPLPHVGRLPPRVNQQLRHYEGQTRAVLIKHSTTLQGFQSKSVTIHLSSVIGSASTSSPPRRLWSPSSFPSSLHLSPPRKSRMGCQTIVCRSLGSLSSVLALFIHFISCCSDEQGLNEENSFYPVNRFWSLCLHSSS